MEALSLVSSRHLSSPRKRGSVMANSKEITMILKGSELERALELDNTSLYLRTFVYDLSPLEY